MRDIYVPLTKSLFKSSGITVSHFFSMLPSTLNYLYSVEPVRMHFPTKQPCTNDTVCNAACSIAHSIICTFSQLFISSTHLDDLLEISNVHALSLHDLHDHAIHVVQMGVTVAGPPGRGARRADVAAGTTHTAVSRTCNTGRAAHSSDTWCTEHLTNAVS